MPVAMRDRAWLPRGVSCLVPPRPPGGEAMPDTDLHRPCLAPLRAAAEAAELAQAVSGLVSIDGCRLADTHPLAPLARDIARSMTEAGLTVHHCAQHDPLYPLR